jgi:hypothetical protein
MTARHLATSEAAKLGGWSVFAYDPGLTPGTGLIRNQPWIVRKLVWPALPLFVPFAEGMNTLGTRAADWQNWRRPLKRLMAGSMPHCARAG